MKKSTNNGVIIISDLSNVTEMEGYKININILCKLLLFYTKRININIVTWFKKWKKVYI